MTWQQEQQWRQRYNGDEDDSKVDDEGDSYDTV